MVYVEYRVLLSRDLFRIRYEISKPYPYIVLKWFDS